MQLLPIDSHKSKFKQKSSTLRLTLIYSTRLSAAVKEVVKTVRSKS